ncbi:winged helix-turn-helix domain-containing protein [Catenovulum sp. SM1970]|uniref:winged helix-turn-helix domain-containing protein n=1 Tax=Marinifaba aquimaris TaxID=2741323 RepID=UPI0015749DD8|nr:winged helix-turn-helix domain-containing protein [Marinifaba aquimaris]NTS76010.1 winged helix-turn-helix domain-containing protein [Marinifaba aquimaris]
MSIDSLEKFKLKHWLVDPINSTITSDDGETKKLERRLIRVLQALAIAKEQTLSKEALLEEVWAGKVVSDETISVAISGLRKALGCNAKSPIFIATITGFGFRLLPKVEQIQTELSSLAADKHIVGKPKRVQFTIAASIIVIFSVVWIYFAKPKYDYNAVPQNLLANEQYAKAIFLIQQPDRESLAQGEELLASLYEQMPNDPHVINAYGKSILFQVNWQGSTTERDQVLEQAKSIFNQGYAIAPQFADLLMQLGLIAIYQSNVIMAERYLRESIQIAPKDPLSHKLYASMAIALGDTEAALHHIQVHRNLSPKEYSAENIAWVYNMSKEYDKAISELAKLKAINPNSISYHTAGLKLYENMGDEKTAYQHYRANFELVGYSEQELRAADSAFNQGGLKQLNAWLANVKKEKLNIGQYWPPISTARYHITAGEYDKAMKNLEKAVADNNNLILWLNVDPKYQPLKSNPQFQRIIKQLRLPKE